jgi:integrase
MLFQLHTMARPSEAAGAQWSELDLEAGLWVIPAERMKKRRQHVVPLTNEILSIISALKMFKRPDAQFLFPSTVAAAGHLNASTANNALKRTLYLGERTTAHGFRATASTALNEAGFDADLIEMSLAHIDKNTVRAAYNRSQYIERRKPLMSWWSSLIAGDDKSIVGDVVPIRAEAGA